MHFVTLADVFILDVDDGVQEALRSVRLRTLGVVENWKMFCFLFLFSSRSMSWIWYIELLIQALAAVTAAAPVPELPIIKIGLDSYLCKP